MFDRITSGFKLNVTSVWLNAVWGILFWKYHKCFVEKQLIDPKYPLIWNVFNCSEAFSPPISEITSYFKVVFAHMDDQE